MTVASSVLGNNPAVPLTEAQKAVLSASAVDPDWAATGARVTSHGCDLRFPGLTGHPDGVVRACDSCRTAGRPKYRSPAGHTPQPTILHDAGPASGVLYVEGVLKSLVAAQLAETAGLPWTVVFLNGADGVNAGTHNVVGPQIHGRHAVVVYDADVESNPNVAAAALRVEGHLRRAGAATVRFGRVPRVADDPHTGLDDYLSAIEPDGRTAALCAVVDGAPPDLLDRNAFIGRCGELDAPGRLALARRTADRVCSLSLEEVWVQEWRALLKEHCSLTGTDFDAIRKEAAARKRDASRERAHNKITEAGPEMPAPGQPLEVAHELLARRAAVGDHVRIWRGDWYQWDGTKWAQIPVTVLSDWLRRDLRHAWYMSSGKEPAPVPWAPTSAKVSEVIDALASILRRADTEEADTGIYTLGGVVALDGTLTEHTPEVFNLTCLPYAYDPAATAPNWDRFLETSLPDVADRELLQEMFGYLLSGETNQQKIFFLSGPPGAGKGTALRVLQGLVGHESHTSASLPGIGSHFGLASLIGKSVAVLPDVRFNVSGASDALPNLLSISGEDVVPVHRKNRDDWVGMLPTRLVMASNDLPALPDSSAALYRRLVVVRFGESFTGREDYGLTGRLLAELPGILNWALAGYRRLTERGKFLATAGGSELAAEARREASPVVAFIEDMCTADPEAFISSHDLFAAWTAYRLDQHFTRKDISQPGLTRAVKSALPGVGSQLRKINGKPVRGLTGIRLGVRTG